MEKLNGLNGLTKDQRNRLDRVRKMLYDVRKELQDANKKEYSIVRDNTAKDLRQAEEIIFELKY